VGKTRAEQINRIVVKAIGLEAAELEAFLREACSDDSTLLSEVRRVIAGEAQGKTVVDEDSHVTADLPKSIGRYRIRRVLGSGGMGTVYEAMQDKPRRKVAVKVMRAGITSPKAARRFEYESQILGRLSHPGIAKVFEAGTYDDGSGGVPYFAMEYVPGAKTILQYVHERTPDRRDVLALFCQVCDAVHHGHTKGIIHRDLKPGNVLVDSDGAPRIIDFGVARATDSDMAVTTMQTDVGQLIGTVQYMSPEQCEADPDILDTRSDVYALGVMLFELLSGRLPYDLKTVPIYQAANIIREGTATRLGTVDRGLRGDLETIVAKAIEKDRDRRYQSALELKQDIERFLRDDPIEARPPSLVYQTRLLMRRHRGLAAAIVIIVFILAGATVWSLLARSRALVAEQAAQTALIETQSARDLAEQAATRASRVAGFLEHVISTASPKVAQGKTHTISEAVDLAAEDIDEQFGDLPLVEAQVRHTIGKLYLQLGRLDDAQRQLLEAVSLRSAQLSADHEDVIQVRATLAEVLLDGERLVEADEATQTLLALAEKTLDDDSLTKLNVMMLRNRLLAQLGRNFEAPELGQQVADRYRRLLGPQHELTLGAELMVLGQLLNDALGQAGGDLNTRIQESGLKARADSLLARSVKGLGAAHPTTIQMQLMLAVVASFTDDIATADALLNEAIASARRVLGPLHPETLSSLMVQGLMVIQLGDLDRAESILNEAISGLDQTTGLNTPSALQALAGLANLQLGRGKYAKAAQMAQRSLEAQEEIYGAAHPALAQSRAVLGAALALDGLVAQARDPMEQSIEELTAILGSSNVKVLNQMLIWASCLLGSVLSEEQDEGMALIVSIHATAKASLGWENDFTLATLATGIKGGLDMKRRAGLMDLVRPMAIAAVEVPGPRTGWRLISAAGLNFLAKAGGDDVEVLDLVLPLRVQMLEAPGAAHQSTLQLGETAILLLDRLGRRDEADAILLEVLPSATAALGADEPLRKRLEQRQQEVSPGE
jgi:tetratricopeptide (TPR) repeat protein/serine/threonine-protein kinase RIO1